MNHFWQQYRWSNLTSGQQCQLMIGIVIVAHFTIGLSMWLLVTWKYLNWGLSPYPWVDHVFAFMVLSRIWKSVAPFAIALASLYLIPSRPKLSFRLICAVLAFSVMCAWYDIWSGNYDASASGGATPEENFVIYFNWWWY